MLFKALVLGALTASVSAAPTPVASTSCEPSSTAESVSTPTLPSTGSSDLPQPPRDATLKRIAVGHGIQNYTCDSADKKAKASATGALAVLYDVTHLYPGTPRTGLSAPAFSSLPTTILWSQTLPLNMQNDTSFTPSSSTSSSPRFPYTIGAVVDDPFSEPPADLALGDMNPVRYLGRHYFDAEGSPNFDLRDGTGSEALYARVAKKESVAAPAGADAGILGTGAADWLRLDDDGTGATVGIRSVYRVATAGGNPEPCSVAGTGSESVPYTAMYWFYG